VKVGVISLPLIICALPAIRRQSTISRSNNSRAFSGGAKRILPRLLYLAVTSILLCFRSASAQTLRNPGLESSYAPVTGSATAKVGGQVAEGWSDNSSYPGAHADLVYSQDAEVKHGGLSSQKIVIGTPEGHPPFLQIAQWLNWRSLRHYTFRVWMKASQPLEVMITLREGGGRYVPFVQRSFKVTPDWTLYTLSGQATDTEGVLLINARTAGTLWLDDASLTQAPARVTPPAKPVAASFFGMHLLNVNGLFEMPPTPWPPTGVGTLRLHDSGVFWRDVEKERGRFDWTRLDVSARRAAAHKADVIYVLGQTPPWAAARPDAASIYNNPGASSEPARLEDWRNYVSQVARRYKTGSPYGRIRYFEIWNEPNDPAFYSGSVETMVEMARVAREVILQADPSNRIISPGVSVDLSWISDFLSRGGGKCVDIIGYHPYAGTPEAMAALLANARAALKELGLAAKPLWNTEAGWFYTEGRITPGEIEAGYVARTYILNWAFGAERYMHYKWDQDAGMGIWFLDTDKKTLLPAATAYRVVQSWLTGSTLSGVTRTDESTWTVSLTRADGRKAWIVWNPRKFTTFAIPAQWAVKYRQDLAPATETAYTARAMTVGQTPVLLTGR
jgi:hypothetical protein